ncbi:MAG: LLM class flavin-dependent oxidoreductase [Actinomycetes bacterium]
MRYAVGIPNLGAYADPRLLADLAGLAERSGWDGVFCWDHLSRHGEPATDPQVALAAMALATQRVRLGAMVTPLARRRPAKVARETAALDRLSGGRLIVGVGLGAHDEEEFGAFGDPVDRVVRGQMLDEALEVVTSLWTGDPVAHDGDYYMAHTTSGFHPVPVQRPRIPIWVAGTWPARPAFRRAARFDGVFPTFRDVGLGQTVEPSQLAEAVDYANRQRDPDLPALEVAVEATSPAAAPMDEYAAAGLTWWVESIGWFRGTPQEMRSLISNGPPAP